MLIIDLQKCAILSYKIYILVFSYVSCSSSTSELLGKDIISLKAWSNQYGHFCCNIVYRQLMMYN